MARPWNQIEVEKHGDVHCVRLRYVHMDELQLQELGSELTRLLEEEGCCKLVLNLGPPDPMCLYSVFLAKMVTLQRRLTKAGGGFKLAHVSPDTFKIFEACHLHTIFDFYPDQQAAIAAFSA